MDYKKLVSEEREKIRKELQLKQINQSQITSEDNLDNDHKLLYFNTEILCDGEDNVESLCDFHLTLPDDFELQSYSLKSYKDVYYIPDVINEEQESSLLDLIHCAGEIDTERWKQLRTRRLQCWGKFPPSSDRTTQESVSELEEFVPNWLTSIIDELVVCDIFDEFTRPNNILINQYTPLEGILHHTDGPIYHDKVAIISLNSDCVMTFRHHLSSSEIGSSNGGRSCGDVFSVLLRRRSLLYFSKDVYSEYMHGIESLKDVQVIGGDGFHDSNGEELCECLNAVAANVIPGDEIRRGLRTSLTFRKLKI